MCGARSHTPFSLILVFSLTSSLPRSPPPFNESLISVYVNANDTVCHCVQSSLLAFKPGTFTTVNLLGGGANVFTGRGVTCQSVTACQSVTGDTLARCRRAKVSQFAL